MASIAKRPDGRWRVRYQAPDKTWHAKHFDKKTDAKRYLDGITTQKGTNTYVAPALGKLTVGEWVDKWLAGKVSLKVSTRATYTSIVGHHVKPRWENLALADVVHEDVAEWIGDLRAGGLSASRVRQVHIVFSSALEAAVRSHRLAVNPARGVELPRLPPPNHRYLTHGEVAALADECREYGTLIKVLSYAGLRFGEAAALRVKHVDVLRARLTIAQSVTEVDGHLIWSTPKTHMARTISIPRSVADLLAVEVAGKGPDDAVFQSPTGEVIRERNWRRYIFNAAAMRIGQPGLTPHALRHTCASLAISAGAHVVAVSRLLGHANPNITLGVYSHLFENDLEDVAARLDEAAAKFRGTNEGLNVLELERGSRRRIG